MEFISFASKLSRKVGMQRLAYRMMAMLPITPPETLNNLTSEAALKLLHAISPDKGGGCVRHANYDLDKPVYDVEIIIPVYNAEQYIEECIGSVLGQHTSRKIHVIVVNDGSTDGTKQMLRQYDGNDLVTIIHQANSGHSGARNTGLRHARGRYLMFVDADDRLPQGAIEALISKAVDGDYDIVMGGHTRFNDSGTLETKMPQGGLLSGFFWGKIFKATIWQGVELPEGYWFEDTLNAFILNDKAKKTATIPTLVYEWRRNTQSISFTSKGQPKILDTVYVTLQLLNDRKRMGLPMDDEFCETIVHQLKVNATRVWSLGDRRADYANYMVSKQIYGSYCGDFSHANSRHKEIARALNDGSYKQYVLACMFL